MVIVKLTLMTLKDSYSVLRHRNLSDSIIKLNYHFYGNNHTLTSITDDLCSVCSDILSSKVSILTFGYRTIINDCLLANKFIFTLSHIVFAEASD